MDKSTKMMDLKMKKVKREFAKDWDKRIEFALDNVLKGKIITFGTTDLVTRLAHDKNLNIEIARFEGKYIGFMFKEEKEFHTLHFTEKNEELKNYIYNISGNIDVDLNKLIGISIYSETITDGIGIIAYELKDEEFNRENVKKMVETIFPTADAMFVSAHKDCIQNFADRIMVNGIINVTGKRQRRLDT